MNKIRKFCEDFWDWYKDEVYYRGFWSGLPFVIAFAFFVFVAVFGPIVLFMVYPITFFIFVISVFVYVGYQYYLHINNKKEDKPSFYDNDH